MGNMSYCRFENTLKDLRDCYNHMGDDDLSETEETARLQMIRLCKEIVEDFGDEVEEVVTSEQLLGGEGDE